RSRDGMSTDQPWPSEIRLNAGKNELALRFDNGEGFSLPAEYLRVESPSAEVRGHGPEERKTVAGKRNVKISAIESVGNYAVRLIFDDGHDTGLYSWALLLELGREKDEKIAAYLEELRAQGLSRD